MPDTIPEFAFPSERFLLSGYGEHAVYFDPTIICKYKGKTYLAHESLTEFATLITHATLEQQEIMTDAIKDLKGVNASNYETMIDIEQLEGLRALNSAYVTRYLDHLKSL